MKKLVIVDDHPIVRRGLVELISQESDLVVCAQAGAYQEALDALKAHKPDLLIVDVALDGASGIDLVREVRTLYPELAVLVLSMYEETLYAERALRAGAYGYVIKVEAADTLLKAIRRILQGEIFVSEKMAGRLIQGLLANMGESTWHQGMGSLSSREQEVFEMIGRGLTTRGIADKLRISTKTIETHRSHIKNKLHLKNASELTHCAVNWVNGNGSASATGAE